MKKNFVIAILASLMLMLLSSCEGANAYIGYWKINEIYAGDVTMTMEEVMDMGLDPGFVKLQKSGAAVVNLLGDEYDGTWVMNEDGSGATITYDDERTGTATLDGKVMTFVDAQGCTFSMTRF